MRYLLSFTLLLALSGCENDQGFVEHPPSNNVGDLSVSGRACDPGFDVWVEGAIVYTHLIDEKGRLYKTLEATTDEQGYWTLTGLLPQTDYTIYVQFGTTLISTFDVFVEVEDLTLTDPACSPPDDFRAAVITGDYDKFGKVLKQLGVENYDVINGKTGSSLEQFLSSEVALSQYSVVFFPGGHREEDIVYDSDGTDIDGVVPLVKDSLRNYVNNGGVIYASDWSYDMIEQVWPEYIEFFGDDALPDDAQVGSEATVIADITNGSVETTLGFSDVEISFDLDTYPIIESVSGDTLIYMEADVPYRIGMETYEVRNSPIMVGFAYGEGIVLYSTWRQYSNMEGDALEVIRMMVNLAASN
jgi:hypothetical protein